MTQKTLGEDSQNKHTGGSYSSQRMHRRKWRGNRWSQQDTWGTQSLSCCLAKSFRVCDCGQIMLWQGDQIVVKPKHWFIWKEQGGLSLLTVRCLCGGYATQKFRSVFIELLLWPTGDIVRSECDPQWDVDGAVLAKIHPVGIPLGKSLKAIKLHTNL